MSTTKNRRIDDDRARRLQELLADLARVGGGASVGCLKFVDLAPMAVEIDEVSPDKVDALTDTALATLAERVKHPNIFYQHSETLFVVIFVDDDEQAALDVVESCKQGIVERMETEHGVRVVDASVEVKQLSADELVAQSKAFLAKAEADKQKKRDPLPVALAPGEKLHIRFRPFWRTSNASMGAFEMTARRTGLNGAASVGYDALGRNPDRRKLANFDVAMLGFGSRALEQAMVDGEKFLIMAPIAYEAFADPSVTELYRTRLDGLPAAVRRRFCLTVTGVNPKADARQLMLNLNYLSAYCQAILVQLPLDPEGFIDLKSARISVVGASVAGESEATSGLRSRLENFVRSVAHFRRPLYLTGVETEAVARLACDLGVEFLSGPFVADDLSKPRGVEFKVFEELAGIGRVGRPKGAAA